jgi:hypothetical protein
LHIKVQTDLSRRSIWNKFQCTHIEKRFLLSAGKKHCWKLRITLCLPSWDCSGGETTLDSISKICNNFSLSSVYVCALIDADRRQLANRRCKLIKLKFEHSKRSFGNSSGNLSNFFFFCYAFNIVVHECGRENLACRETCKQFSSRLTTKIVQSTQKKIENIWNYWEISILETNEKF